MNQVDDLFISIYLSISQQPLNALINSLWLKVGNRYVPNVLRQDTKWCPQCTLQFQSVASHRPGCKKCIVDKEILSILISIGQAWR